MAVTEATEPVELEESTGSAEGIGRYDERVDPDDERGFSAFNSALA